MIKVIKALVAIAGLALAIYGFWYMQFAPLAADNGHGVVYACRGDEKYGYTEGGTAEMQEARPVSDSPLAAGRTANRSAVVWPAVILGVGLVVGLGILLADPVHSPAEDAASKPCPAQTSISGTPANITVPDIVGQNAGGVEDRIKSLGLTNVELSSANPDYKSVWVASNWTVVSTDPTPGCLVNRYDRVVVYVTK